MDNLFYIFVIYFKNGFLIFIKIFFKDFIMDKDKAIIAFIILLLFFTLN